jgi:hypothetical protein
MGVCCLIVRSSLVCGLQGFIESNRDVHLTMEKFSSACNMLDRGHHASGLLTRMSTKFRAVVLMTISPLQGKQNLQEDL